MDEDGANASFAGQHLTLLNVPSAAELTTALREIWWSANSDSAITYRKRVGLFTRPSVAVVVQVLLDPKTAGVMFTQNPITGAHERMIEASWGLGEVVVAGMVIPDSYRVDADGHVLERRGGTETDRDPRRLHGRHGGGRGGARARRAALPRRRRPLGAERAREQVRGRLRPGAGYRVGDRPREALPAAVPCGDPGGRLMAGAPIAALRRVPLFAELSDDEVRQIALLFKERHFAAGECVVKEGADGAAFFLIESGEATVTVAGKPRDNVKAGDHFGEIALIDEGVRSATITATSDLVCYGLTFWEFRPLVIENGAIGWKLLHSLARKLRSAEQV